MFLGPETSQETLKKPKSRPRSTQRAPKPMQKLAKKNPKKCLRGKKCLKPAISFWTVSGPHFLWLILLTFKLIFGLIFGHFLKHFWSPFWDPFWNQASQEGPRWAQKSHQELQRTKKLHFQKSGFRGGLSAFFRSWGLPREPQEAQEGSQEAPKGFHNGS